MSGDQLPAQNLLDLSSGLKLKIFNPPVVREAGPEFERVFQFWNELWIKANAEMGRPGDYYSEQLTRQHEILVLYVGARPVALVCHRYVDLAAESTHWDSYLRALWSEDERQVLKARGGEAVFGSQITIDPEFRKMNGVASTKYLISFLSLAWAQRTGVDTIVGMMRVDKGMDRVFYEAGAMAIARAIKYHKITVDFVMFEPNKQNGIVIPQAYLPLVRQLISGASEIPSARAFDFKHSPQRQVA